MPIERPGKSATLAWAIACALLLSAAPTADAVASAPTADAVASAPTADGVATAATQHTQSASRIFRVRAQTTATITLAFPFALKFANASYSGKVRVLATSRLARGQTRPRRSLVKVLSRGPAQGGSVYRVKVRNNNAGGTAPVRVRVTTTTTWSS